MPSESCQVRCIVQEGGESRDTDAIQQLDRKHHGKEIHQGVQAGLCFIFDAKEGERINGRHIN